MHTDLECTYTAIEQKIPFYLFVFSWEDIKWENLIE